MESTYPYSDLNKALCDEFDEYLSSKLEDELSVRNKTRIEEYFLSQLKFSEEVKSLENRLTALDENIKGCQKASDEIDKTVNEKESNVAFLNQELQKKLLVFEMRKDILHEEEVLVAQLEKRGGMKRIFSEADHNKMQEILSLYNNMLSFKIDFVRDGSASLFILKFTNIDRENLQKVFSVTLRLHSSNFVSITDCSPEVIGIKKLEDSLNEEMDFHRFSVSMRKLFKNYVING